MTTRVLIVNFGPEPVRFTRSGTSQSIYPGQNAECYLWKGEDINIRELGSTLDLLDSPHTAKTEHT